MTSSDRSASLGDADSASATSVGELRTMSGLTTDQISRLFGTRVRKVHGWVAGATMTPRDRDRLQSLVTRIRPLGTTPDERRRHLLYSADGPSVFRRMRAEAPQDQVINAPALSVRERLCLPIRTDDVD